MYYYPTVIFGAKRLLCEASVGRGKTFFAGSDRGLVCGWRRGYMPLARCLRSERRAKRLGCLLPISLK
jgi:hypothetical protein